MTPRPAHLAAGSSQFTDEPLIHAHRHLDIGSHTALQVPHTVGKAILARPSPTRRDREIREAGGLLHHTAARSCLARPLELPASSANVLCLLAERGRRRRARGGGSTS